MTWSDFYLFCFIVGFALSVLLFFAGAVHIHLPFKMHVPFHLGHHGGVGGGVRGGVRGGVHVSWFNASTAMADRKSTRLNSSHQIISYAVFCLKKKKKQS